MGNLTYVRQKSADIVAVVSVAAAIACGGEAQLDYRDDVRQTTESADSVLRVELASTEYPTSAELTTGWSAGTLRGDQALGLPVAAVVLKVGSVVILDRRRFAVLRYANRDLLEVVGNRGDGPGEFEVLRDVAMGPSGLLAVLDAPHDIHLYRVGDGNLTHRESLVLRDLYIQDFCWNGEEFIVLGSKQGSDKWFHRFRRDGTYRGSFGRVVQGRHGHLESALRRGSIDCVDGTPAVFFRPTWLPYVYAFRMDGSMPWVAELQGYTPAVLRPQDDGGMIFDYFDDGAEDHYHAAGAIHVSDGRVAVQVRRYTRESLSLELPFDRVSTLFLNAADGSVVLAGDLDREILEMSRNRLVLRRLVPFPRVSLVELEG